MKNRLQSLASGLKLNHIVKNTFAHKVTKFFTKNRRKLCKSHFFDYLCEKIKN